MEGGKGAVKENRNILKRSFLNRKKKKHQSEISISLCNPFGGDYDENINQNVINKVNKIGGFCEIYGKFNIIDHGQKKIFLTSPPPSYFDLTITNKKINNLYLDTIDCLLTGALFGLIFARASEGLRVDLL